MKAISDTAQAADGKAVRKVPTDLTPMGVLAITTELRCLLADVFALQVKTRNFHWHMSGRHFRDSHLLLDAHAEQIAAMIDNIAERAPMIGGTMIRSIGEIARHQRIKDNDEMFVSPHNMLSELLDDNQKLTSFMRAAHAVCEQHDDVATASQIEIWIDLAECRSWFLLQIVSGGEK